MKILTSHMHGILDYVTVLLFAVAPMLLGLNGLAATLSYVLAAVHLLLTLVTRFPLSAAKLVPFHLHGVIELIVSIVLVVLAFALFDGTARVFYLAVGAVIFLVWALSDYHTHGEVATP